MPDKSTRTSPLRLSLWAISYAVRRWRALGMVILAMVAKTGLDVLQPWPMKLIVDNVLGDQSMPSALRAVVGESDGAASAYELLAWCVIATVVLFLVRWMVGVAETFASISLGQRMSYDLAAQLFAYLQRLSLRFHHAKSVGDTIRRVTSDCTCVSTIVRDAMLPAAGSLFTLMAMFAILWELDPALTMLSLLAVPYMALVLYVYARPMEQRSYEHKEAEGRLYDVVEGALTAVPVIQAFTAESQNDRHFQQGAHSILQAARRSTSVDLQFKILMTSATVGGTAAVIWVGGSHVLSGKLSVGSVLVFLAYLRSLYAPLEALMYSSATVQGATGSARRVREILKADVEVQDAPDAVPLPRVAGHLSFRDVTFGYDPNQPVLRNITLDVPAGQTVAIVGSSGAGKTTLVSLLLRFYDPQQGSIEIDGHDIRDVQLKSLRRQIALVLQQPFLFPVSIADNISYGRPSASREEIEDAARAANAHGFISALPSGYDTVVGERGSTLSGGEKQRLAVARALLTGAPLLVLDEPTSSVDVETETQMLDAIERLADGRTTLIIAHRLSTVRNADKIVVLRDGTIVESGTHDELMQIQEVYYHMYRLQSHEPFDIRQAGAAAGPAWPAC